MKRFALIFLILVPARVFGMLKACKLLYKPTISSRYFSHLKQEALRISEILLTTYNKSFPLNRLGEIVNTIIRMVQTEAKHPGYKSFFHGANGNLGTLLELQKILYATYHNGGKIPTDFEFLRARKGREHLVGITREKFTTKKNICDKYDSDRTDLLSVGYVAWGYQLHYYWDNHSDFPVYLEKWITEALATYNLPIPSNTMFPSISHGILLHILVKKPLANRLVYNSQPYGVPASPITLPGYPDIYRLNNQARIILDKSVFDQPNDDVKIYRHQQLTDQEKKEIDRFCDELIKKAQKLKERQELEKTRS